MTNKESHLDTITVKALNLDIIWEKPEANFQKISDELAHESADIFVLPEMFSTGFSMNPIQIADHSEKTLQWLETFSKQKNAAITGSVSIKEGDEFFNRMYFVTPEGKVEYYDKRHLFSFSGEDKVYSAGKRRVIVEYLGVRFLLQVCYDLRFPVFSRNMEDYDVAIYVANWPRKRISAWELLLKARAIENQVYVLGVNRVGVDGNQLEYPESTYAFFADGNQISVQSGNIISFDIDLQKLKKFRNHYTFLQDRDWFEIKD